jgi:2,4-diketo-3-deoxy-L-fuconate hydrolase
LQRPVLVNVSSPGSRPFPAWMAWQRALALSHWADRGVPLRGAASIGELLREWASNAPLLCALSDDHETPALIERHGSALAGLAVHAPVEPGQVFCTIGNYRCQWLEAALDADDGPEGEGAPQRRAAARAAIDRRITDGEPYVCLKSRTAVAGPFDTLVVAPEQRTLDWEVEIGAVIGRPAWRVSAAQAAAYIAGYCVVNDLTLRERVFRRDPQPLGTDWLQSKGAPGWLPAGPWFVPAWQVPDAGALRLRLRLNGRTMQDGAAREMVFSIAEQIAYLSQQTRLEPGDLLCTGSPAGFGSHHRRYLQPGDVVEATVDGLGEQRVRCVAPRNTDAETTTR